MVLTPSKALLLVIFNIILLGKSQGVSSEGRDFAGYLPVEEKQPDYQVYPYPPSYSFKEDYSECAKNPILPLLGKGLNIILLKLGAIGIIKAVVTLAFLGLLVKLPLLMLKGTILKSFFFPFMMAPMLLNLFASEMTQSSGSSSQMKPAEAEKPAMPAMPAMMAGMMPAMMQMGEMTKPMTDMVMSMGKQLNDNLTSAAWQSLKIFAESDQCAEKISCMIGASSKDSSMESIFKRILKYIHHSSPPVLQKRVNRIREAFNKGSKSSTCLQEDYECHSPELLLQYGIKKVKLL